MTRKILIEFDKSGAEWVIVAYLSGDARMLEVVESGRSPHPVTAKLISGVPEPLIIAESKLVGLHTDPEIIKDIRQTSLPELYTGDYFLPRHMSLRQMGKKSNHGLNYNMRYKRFALENEMDEGDAKTIVTKYREEAYMGIPIWHEAVRRQLQKDRTLINCFGRKRVFRDQWGDELFDAAFSYLPQSTVFDITREGMVSIMEDTSSELESLELLAQVHDSNLTQVDLISVDHLTEVLYIVGHIYMNPELRYNGRTFHIGTEAKIGFNWSGMLEVKITGDKRALRKQVDSVWEQLHDNKAA